MYGLHGAYKDLNGRLMKYPPAYTYADGFFLLANVSPLVSPADTDDPRVAAVLAQPLAYVSSSDRIGSRNAETFLEQGLVVRLQAALKDFYSANAEAKRVALRAIRRDPMGFLSLAFETYRLFFSETTMVAIVSAESGVREFAPEEERILNHYHLDARGLPFMKTVTRQYYMASWRYYWLLTPAPFALLACVPFARKEWKRPLWFLFLACGLHAGIVQVMGVVPSPRHLHSMAVVLAVAIGVAATRLWAAPAEPEESLPTSARAGASGR
jgi:hypothetical protein